MQKKKGLLADKHKGCLFFSRLSNALPSCHKLLMRGIPSRLERVYAPWHGNDKKALC